MFNQVINCFEGAYLSSLYTQVPILAACINRIAATCGSTNIRIFDKNNNEIVSGKLYNLLNYPTTNTSQSELLNYLVIQYYLYGLSATEITKSSLRYMNSPSLVPINPGYSWREDISSYSYMSKTVQSTNIIQQVNADIRFPGDINVISPIYSLINQLDTYRQGVKFINDYFRNGGRPSYIVNVPLTDKDALKAFESKWKEKFSNSENPNQPFFIGSNPNVDGEFSLEQVTSSLDEILMPELNVITIEDCSSTTGVPSILLSGSQARYDSAYEQILVYYANTIFPLLNKYQQSFQSQLIRNTSSTWNLDTKKSKVSLNKDMKNKLSKAIDTNSSDNLFIIFDTDSLPFSSELTLKKTALAQSLIDIGVKNYEASVYADLDLSEDDFETVDVPVDVPVEPAVDDASVSEQVVDDKLQPITYTKESKDFMTKFKKFNFETRKKMLSVGEKYTYKELRDEIQQSSQDIDDLDVDRYSKFVFKMFNKDKNFKTNMNLKNRDTLQYRKESNEE